jgi:hypothetical protein
VTELEDTDARHYNYSSDYEFDVSESESAKEQILQTIR